MMPYHRLLGIQRNEVANGESEVRMPFQDSLLNSLGIVHGGAIMSLLDAALGAAVGSAMPGVKTVTAEMNVSFLAPCRTGVVAFGHVVKTGRMLAVAEAKAYDDEERLIAVARGTFAVVPEDKR